MKRKKYKALIIDDERPARQVIIALGKWEKYGIEPPMEVSNCIDAMTILEQQQPDIVFLDMYLPIMDGIEFLKKITPKNNNTKFIVISGFDEFEYARQSLRYGVVEYLLKPVVEEELERAMARAVYLLDAGIGQISIAEMESRDPVCSAEDPDGKDNNIEFRATMEEIADEIRDFIEANYAEDINLDMFSRRYYLTKEYLSRCFKEVVGCGIYEFVTITRMSKVKELLRDTDLKIGEVARVVGYNDQNYFSRAFKKHFGTYPSEYRMMIKQEGGN